MALQVNCVITHEDPVSLSRCEINFTGKMEYNNCQE